VKRWLVALLVSLAVIVLVSPGIVGRLAEKNLDESIEWVATENPDVSVSTERFDRGWFTSAGRHRVVFQGGAFQDITTLYNADPGNTNFPALVIDTRIDHGLVPITSMSREFGSLMPGLASTVSEFQIDPGTGELIGLPGKLFSDIGLSGSSRSRFILEAGSFEKDKLSATWQGADLIVLFNPANGGIAIEGSIEPFSIAEDREWVDIGALTVNVDQTPGDFDFSVGTIEFAMDSLTADSASGPFSMGGFSLAAETSIDDSRLNIASTLSIDDVVVPGMGNVAMAMDVSLERLDAAPLRVVTTALREAQEEDDPQAAMQALYPQIEKDVEKLISAGARIRFDQLDLRLPQGMVSTTLMIEFAEMDEDAAFSWSSVLLAMTASMDTRVPVELYEFVQMMNPQAESLVAMGVLKRQGDDYIMVAEYAQGLLNVNGAPMPIPMPTM
jgi:uncharacterized protein YdgA (DUF945 family)